MVLINGPSLGIFFFFGGVYSMKRNPEREKRKKGLMSEHT